MSSLSGKFFSLFLITSLSACLTLPEVFESGERSAFDGTWSGRLMLTIGEATCLRRTLMTVKVKNGALDGKSTYKNFDARLTGKISADGTIKKGMVKVENDFYTYEIKGRFTGENAKGTWINKSCAGKWELRRVRKTVR